MQLGMRYRLGRVYQNCLMDATLIGKPAPTNFLMSLVQVIRLDKQRSPLGSLERDRLTFSFFSGIIFIVGKYVRLETKFRFGVS